ncbi:MAG: hypothetical protein DHS20C18_23560 [Saprospiraceae bacterium]|nr:MAG: hypothetical protein DHS20C18_23560 [Saprospiraceae bacterium]
MISSENPTKQQELLEAAGELFMKHGIRRVTVAEICQEAGVSKMTFYKYYSNKADLAKAYFLKVANKGMEDYRSIMRQDIAFATKVQQVIQLKLKNTEGISQEFVKDIYQDKRLGLHKIIETKKKESLNEMLRDFEQAAAKGAIRKGINSQFIVYFLDKITEMAVDEKLLALYRNEQELIMELTNFFFYGLGIKDETK